MFLIRYDLLSLQIEARSRLANDFDPNESMAWEGSKKNVNSFLRHGFHI